MTELPTAFREDLRYEYDLNSDSLVIDAGAYHGEFATEIVRRYGSRVYAFEPVYYRHCHNTDRITYFPVGLDSRTHLTTFNIHGTMTGQYAEGEPIPVVLIDICDVISNYPRIDLLKLNIEGGEYRVLEALFSRGLQHRITDIQVQFHRLFDDHEARRQRLRDHLALSHHLTYDFPFTWENWRRNE